LEVKLPCKIFHFCPKLQGWTMAHLSYIRRFSVVPSSDKEHPQHQVRVKRLPIIAPNTLSTPNKVCCRFHLKTLTSKGRSFVFSALWNPKNLHTWDENTILHPWNFRQKGQIMHIRLTLNKHSFSFLRQKTHVDCREKFKRMALHTKTL